MENNETNSNFTAPTDNSGAQLDGANLSQTLGIVGLAVSVVLGSCGCGLVGFILSIIAFVKGKNAVKAYEANPSNYPEDQYKKAKTGKLLGMIGLILGIVVIGISIILFATGFLASLMNR